MRLLVLALAVGLAAAAARTTDERRAGPGGDQKIASIKYMGDTAQRDTTELTKMCLTNGVPADVTQRIRLVYIEASTLQTDYYADSPGDVEGDCVSFHGAPMPADGEAVTYVIGYAIGEDKYSVIDEASFTFEKAGVFFTCGDVHFEKTDGGTDCMNSDGPTQGPCYKELEEAPASDEVCTHVTEVSVVFKYCQPSGDEETPTPADFVASLDYSNQINLIEDQIQSAQEAIVVVKDVGLTTHTSQYASVTGSVVPLDGDSFVPSTNTYCVCLVAGDTLLEDSIDDIEIAAIKSDPYYELGFYYEGRDDVPRYQAKAGDSTGVIIDCSHLEPGTKCYGFVKIDGKDLQVSYLVQDSQSNPKTEKPENTVIFGIL